MKSCLRTLILLWAVSLFVNSATALSILSQPDSQTINAGSTASFSVATTNETPVSYQWQFNGADLPGATAATLTLENVAANQAGTYAVVINPDTDNLASSAATLTVLQGTIIRFHLDPGDVDVELFDHDKPATVENFLHYVTSGSYTNLFFHRLVPNFVLQSGGYATASRSSAALTTLVDIYNHYTQPLFFPFWIDNEYGVGPRIRNTFGTLAMAKKAGDPDSATCEWFFNLADNCQGDVSTNLDMQNGGYTVFGRILNGTNVLNFFNTLSATNGLADFSSPFDNFPSKAKTADVPAENQLYFADMSLLTTPPAADAILPTLAIVSPTNDAILPSGSDRKSTRLNSSH